MAAAVALEHSGRDQRGDSGAALHHHLRPARAHFVGECEQEVGRTGPATHRGQGAVQRQRAFEREQCLDLTEQRFAFAPRGAQVLFKSVGRQMDPAELPPAGGHAGEYQQECDDNGC